MPIGITGVWLCRELDSRGREFDEAVVFIEVEGRWVEVVREGVSGIFSHMVEVAGMERQIEASR